MSSEENGSSYIESGEELVNLVNRVLNQTFGSEFKGNVMQRTYGYARAPTYHIGNQLEYIAQVTNSEGRLLKLFNKMGTRAGKGIQTDDFLFIGKFTDEKGLRISVFPQYEERMKEFVKQYGKVRKKEIKIEVVKFLEVYIISEIIYHQNNMIKGKENSY